MPFGGGGCAVEQLGGANDVRDQRRFLCPCLSLSSSYLDYKFKEL